jgi:hypothetical protein
MNKNIRKVVLLIALAGFNVCAFAAPYPLGSMTCADIGKFASEAMSWRESGMKKDEALAKLESRCFNFTVVSKNLEGVLRMVFGRYGDSWTQDSAGNVMRTDCEAGR